MIYYPLSALMLAGIREVLVISTPRDLGGFKELLGDGSALGMSFSYSVQEKPRGLADAFIVSENSIGRDRVALVLGDNIFYGHGFLTILEDAAARTEGATIFGYFVKDPISYGVVESDDARKAIPIEEKPSKSKSNYAVQGLYFYDNNVVEAAKNVQPYARGEIEITSVNNAYFLLGCLHVETLGCGFAWLDTGSSEFLLEARKFIETIQKRQGLYVAYIEEIACRKGWIDGIGLLRSADRLGQTDYAQYLRSLAAE